MRERSLLARAVILSLFVAGANVGVAGDRASQQVQFLELTRFGMFEPGLDGEEVWVSDELPTAPWDELVLSWNGKAPTGTLLEFEVRALQEDGPTAYYQMGIWSEAVDARRSVKDQRDSRGRVETDTLLLKGPASGVQLRVRRRGSEGRTAELARVGISLLNTEAEGSVGVSRQEVWGQVLDVPRRSQLAHAGGKDWCSPTSVSMVLGYWAKKLERSELDREVPEVVEGVYDSVWKGTGNWSFNVAFAGSLPGVRAEVRRLSDVSELERYVGHAVPPICSVDAIRLNGRGFEGEVGHLVVVVGFTDEGDLLVNDPFFREGQSGRKTVPREDFTSAWTHSHNTAYLIYPMDWK